MSVQELLTYVEELEFKTSMFGYDKDEVDIQLDKICDEIEAIAKEKDTEIEALKSSQPILVSEVSEEKEEPETELMPEQPEEFSPAPLETESSELAALQDQMEELQQKLDAAQTRAEDLTQQAREAEDRAVLAEEKAELAESRASDAEARLAAVGPQTKEEAYEQYIHNADLLCQQITDMQNKEESIVKNAEENAGKIVGDAQTEADRLMSEAQTEAERLMTEAQTEAKRLMTEAQAEAERLMTETQDKCKSEESHILELRQQKGKVADSLTQITVEVQNVLKKIQDSQEV